MLGKIRMVVGVLLMFPMLLLSMVYSLLPVSLLRLVKLNKAADKWLHACARFTSNYLLLVFGVTIRVSGMEQYPKEAKRICFVSNHQSNLDIPVLFGKANLFAGVITKSELKKVPILNWWCAEMHCIYIDRHSPRSSIQAILGGVQQVKSGHPVLIFPEGTRSKDGNVAEFKAGSFHLATKSDAVIVPYAISGTREAFEKRTQWHVTAYLSMCKPVDVSALTDEEKKQVHTVVENEVRQRHDTLVKTNGLPASCRKPIFHL